MYIAMLWLLSLQRTDQTYQQLLSAGGMAQYTDSGACSNTKASSLR